MVDHLKGFVEWVRLCLYLIGHIAMGILSFNGAWVVDAWWWFWISFTCPPTRVKTKKRSFRQILTGIFYEALGAASLYGIYLLIKYFTR